MDVPEVLFCICLSSYLLIYGRPGSLFMDVPEVWKLMDGFIDNTILFS